METSPLYCWTLNYLNKLMDIQKNFPLDSPSKLILLKILANAGSNYSIFHTPHLNFFIVQSIVYSVPGNILAEHILYSLNVTLCHISYAIYIYNVSYRTDYLNFILLSFDFKFFLLSRTYFIF
jgi:hypothetical protein